MGKLKLYFYIMRITGCKRLALARSLIYCAACFKAGFFRCTLTKLKHDFSKIFLNDKIGFIMNNVLKAAWAKLGNENENEGVYKLFYFDGRLDDAHENLKIVDSSAFMYALDVKHLHVSMAGNGYNFCKKTKRFYGAVYAPNAEIAQNDVRAFANMFVNASMKQFKNRPVW